MADAKKKQLVYNIIDFLRTSAQDGTVKEDDKESMEVAVQCIAEAFGVDPDSASDKAQYSIAPASLLSILEVFLKTKAKAGGGGGPSPAASTPGPTSAPSSAAPLIQPSTSTSSAPTPQPSADPATKASAESLKAKGNALMSQKLYDAAIEQYSAAIALDPNPVYYSNRAAAWGAVGEHEKAVEDAERALELDPAFAKGYSRLGHANFSLGNYPAAISAYESGLRLDPSNSNMKSALATAKARQAESGGSASSNVSEREAAAGGRGMGAGAGAGAGGMPDLSALAGLMGGAGGGAGGGGGGMPDLAAMMRNPQMMAMAQQMMANGGLERLMSNPNLRQMAERFQGGGGMPDMSELANDPSLRDMAQQFMGGGGGGAGAGRGA